jgi:magnesium chelatase subunit D
VASPGRGRFAAVDAPAERVTTILSCLAVDRRIGGVIFIGLPPGLLAHLAWWLCQAIGADPAGVVTLGSAESEDDLWWGRTGGPTESPAESAADDGARLLRGPGRLAEPPYGPPVAVIPDLARAGLAVTRAAVVLAGADTAVVDRHGQHLRWEPRTRWLAACPRSDLGRLSGHLLDRFPVRVDATGLRATRWSTERLRAALADDDLTGSSSLSLPPPDQHVLASARWLRPSLGDACAGLIVQAVGGGGGAPARRDLALGRLARALAALEASEDVQRAHVRRAAGLVGLTVPEEIPHPERETAPDPVPPPDDGRMDDRNSRTAPDETATQDRGGSPMTVTGSPEPVSALEDTASALTGAGSYAEDDPDSLPEFASLRHPWQSSSTRRGQRGLVVGTEATREMADLSIMSTVLEAAKYQRIRRTGASARRSGIIVYGADLRRHRRQGGPDTVVAFVLDHTCRRGWQWTDALAPYLGWAYTRRAAITMVELGHRDGSDLRAEVYRASSVLDRRITASLNRTPGRATPLAYGLDLAIQHLRRQLRYGTASTEQAWLVVVSDGRGNVPLEASLRGQLSGPVGTEGVRDAITVAAGARSLSRVRPVVIAPPGLTHYPELPFDLATALGGIVAELSDVAELADGEL